ncbi:MAG TPA: YlxR family protein [Clostridiaceae bacterium]|nr:YlxR family protein [Clostridiaceae bacterium]
MRKEPERTCVGCRGIFLQKDLIRIVANKEGQVSIDDTGRKPGRGAYLCQDQDCRARARKRQSLQRALRCPVPETIWIDIDQAVTALQDKGEE